MLTDQVISMAGIHVSLSPYSNNAKTCNTLGEIAIVPQKSEKKTWHHLKEMGTVGNKFQHFVDDVDSFFRQLLLHKTRQKQLFKYGRFLCRPTPKRQQHSSRSSSSSSTSSAARGSYVCGRC